MKTKYLIFAVISIVFTFTIAVYASFRQPPEFPDVNSHLTNGQLTEVEASLASYVKAKPNDPQANFALGTVQFLQAIEGFSQSLYRYGLDPKTGETFGIPFLRLPVPSNPNPDAIHYQTWRSMLQQFQEDLAKADKSLAKVEDNPVKLTIDFGNIHLDLNGDSKITDGEEFWRIYSIYNPAIAELDEETLAFPIAFDTGDAYWLRGYGNLLSAIADMILAHDTKTVFETSGHLFFTGIESHRDFYSSLEAQWNLNWVDILATVHLLLRLELVEPERMQNALEHLQTTIALSRLSWDSILAEEDNDREWVPNPQQDSVIPARVSQVQIDSWLSLLTEGEAVLKGEKLIPHWRVQAPNVGINLNRIFMEPQTLDFVLWVHGSGISPYLESGELTDRETWLALVQAFGRNFGGFSIWFN